MLTRMREEYDVSHDTATAVELGLARTGKLVTSAALVLMFAFIVLASSPASISSSSESSSLPGSSSTPR
jgi:RND superfamily putative drug exporter